MTNPIKVVQIITRLIIGGAQETVMLMGELLSTETFSVTIVSGPQTGSEGSLIETIRERGLHLHLEPTLVREVHPVKDLLALIRLITLIRRERYTVVHTHSSKAGILGRWAAKFAGAPVIVHTVHGWGHHERQHPFVRRYYILLENLTLRITDKLIVVSSLNAEKGLQDGIGRPDDYVVIRSGIELERFGRPQVPTAMTRDAWGIPQTAKVVGTVTRLSPQKAPLDFIAAAASIAQAEPTTWFVMVGDGPLRAEVEAKAKAAGIADRLVLTGLRRDVPELMAMFDIFVLSSLWEGLPRVLPQAMATGLPIVATACDGTAEAIVHGENGFLAQPGEPAEIADFVVSLLRDPDKARAMGMAGRAGAVEYSDRTMAKEIEALYHALLAAKGIQSL